MIELQSKVLRTPLLKVKIKDAHQDVPGAIYRLYKEEGIEGFVTGDSGSVGHKLAWDDLCKRTGMEWIKPLWDMPLYSANSYRERVFNMEL